MSTLTGEYRHVPVMLEEVLRELDPKPGEVVCDCTLGGAGHSVELARRVAPDGLSIGIDQDDMALEAATERFSREVPEADFLPLKGNFGDLDRLLVEAEVPGVDCFLFDLGVSSPQLDIPERGFSYHEDAPLDMRMDSGNNTLTAQEVVNTYNEADLTRILRVYGDERFASKIARTDLARRGPRPPSRPPSSSSTSSRRPSRLPRGEVAGTRRERRSRPCASRSTTSSRCWTGASGPLSGGPTRVAGSASSPTTPSRTASLSTSSRSCPRAAPAHRAFRCASAATCRSSESRRARLLSPPLRRSLPTQGREAPSRGLR